jgi:hypothetical protein
LLTHAQLTEAILNNEPCFLADDIWEPVFQSLVDEHDLLADRSQMAVDLSKYFARFCGVFKDVTSLVCGDVKDKGVWTKKLRLKLLEFAEGLTVWGVRYDAVFRRARALNPEEVVMEAHWTTMGIFLTCTLFGARLLGAISGFQQRIVLEAQCLRFAEEIVEIVERERGDNLEIGLGLAQKVRVAKATQLTALEWSRAPSSLEGDDGFESELIEKWKFVRWCELFGRRTS